MYQNYLPFPLGTAVDDTDSAGNFKRKSYEGQRFKIPSIQPTLAPRSSIDRLNGLDMEVVCLRNRSGVVLPAKRLVQLKIDVDGSTVLQDCGGMANAANQRLCVFTDPFLPATGVPDKALFWAVLQGPTTVKCPNSTSDLVGDIAVGDPLVSSAAGSGLTDISAGGRIAKWTVRVDTAGNLGADILASQGAIVGYSLTTRAQTGSSDVEILVMANCQI